LSFSLPSFSGMADCSPAITAPLDQFVLPLLVRTPEQVRPFLEKEQDYATKY